MPEFRWSNSVKKAREIELGWRVKAYIIDVLITFIWNWLPSATALATFVSYTVIAGKPLTVATAFTAISLFSYLQEPMMALPNQVLTMLHGPSPLSDNLPAADFIHIGSNSLRQYAAYREVPRRGRGTQLGIVSERGRPTVHVE